jgi:hypothetical protein
MRNIHEKSQKIARTLTAFLGGIHPILALAHQALRECCLADNLQTLVQFIDATFIELEGDTLCKESRNVGYGA